MTKYIVSACLAGFKSRYDGTDKLVDEIRGLVEKGEAIPFCPEQAGGLSTPRVPAEIIGGRVITKDGADVTARFVCGAEEMLKLARMVGATRAILKSNSPSCGVGSIYDGTFSGNITKGDGAAAALLKVSGIDVMTEDEFINDLKND